MPSLKRLNNKSGEMFEELCDFSNRAVDDSEIFDTKLTGSRWEAAYRNYFRVAMRRSLQRPLTNASLRFFIKFL
jgi:hypothetical protein